MSGTLVVMAKSPVPGLAKTRLAATVGTVAAAEVAAAALLDTLAAGAMAFPPGRRVLALDGDLRAGRRAGDLLEATRGWVVEPQRGRTFGYRLAVAHRRAHRGPGGPVVQVGMDTPHLDADLLARLADEALTRARPVLGPAEDGGWWVLATTRWPEAAVLAHVPMSRPDTGDLTARALAAVGAPPTLTTTLRDVDCHADAEAVAALAPHTTFAGVWRNVRTQTPLSATSAVTGVPG